MLTHTEVPYAYEGQGVGSQLVEKALGELRREGKKVIPSCSFVAAYIRRHPKWNDIVVDRY
jgi:predicted GNAT family acetyltransferase